MFEQAAGLALVGACYPPAMLLASLYLASAKPARTTTAFVLGGLVAATAVGTAALIAIRAGGLSLPNHHASRYGLRLGLGVFALAASVIILRRRPRPPGQGKASRLNPIARLAANPRPGPAFAAGVIMFAFSAAFLAAVQVVATAQASLQATIAAMAMIIGVTLLLGWAPLIAYLVAPEPTTRALHRLKDWLTRHSQVLLAGAVGVIGLVLVAQGVAGLA